MMPRGLDLNIRNDYLHAETWSDRKYNQMLNPLVKKAEKKDPTPAPPIKPNYRNPNLEDFKKKSRKTLENAKKTVESFSKTQPIQLSRPKPQPPSQAGPLTNRSLRGRKDHNNHNIHNTTVSPDPSIDLKPNPTPPTKKKHLNPPHQPTQSTPKIEPAMAREKAGKRGEGSSADKLTDKSSEVRNIGSSRNRKFGAVD